MQVSGSTSIAFAGYSLRLGSSSPTPSSAFASTTAGGPSLRDFARLVLDFRDAHKGLSLAGRHRFAAGAAGSASASSSSGLGLSNTPTAATLSSTEEVNATPTSFSTTSPTFSGASGSDPTIGGTYSGANGDTTLTFTVTAGGVIGVNPATIEVRDGSNNLVDTIETRFDPAGTAYTLTNGLEVSFSSGTVIVTDSFTLDVFATVGSSVDPTKAFDGTGDDAPGFEAGQSVGAGSFTVNGVAISVDASDTIDAVLNRITASAAGVTATFDSGTESVVLTQKTAGSGSTITLGSDSSGFLAATKLDGASVEPGTDDESGARISAVAALSGISTGTFTVNGVDLAVDVDADSLQDVLDRINSSGAGALATYDSDTGKVSIRATGSGSLVLDDGDTALFTTLAIAEGTHTGSRGSSRRAFVDEAGFRKELTEFTRTLSALYGEAYSGFGSATVSGVRRDLDGLVEDAFDEALGKSGSGSLRSGLGIDFVRRDGDRELRVDAQDLEGALRTAPESVIDLLFAREEDDGFDGFVTAIGERLGGILQTLETVLGPDAVGLSLDVSA